MGGQIPWFFTANYFQFSGDQPHFVQQAGSCSDNHDNQSPVQQATLGLYCPQDCVPVLV